MTDEYRPQEARVATAANHDLPQATSDEQHGFAAPHWTCHITHLIAYLVKWRLPWLSDEEPMHREALTFAQVS